jgi:hypothetical protein
MLEALRLAITPIPARDRAMTATGFRKRGSMPPKRKPDLPKKAPRKPLPRGARP